MLKTQVEGFRLSPQQRDLWRLRARGAATAYCCRVLVRIEGGLDVPALRHAVCRAAERNEILSATFDWLPGMDTPLLSVGAPVLPELLEVDLRSHSASERNSIIEEFWSEAGKSRCDLRRGPLLHATLATLEADEHVLLLSMPALCTDAAGLNNLVSEIRDIYAAEKERQAEPTEPIQYVDLAEWQCSVLQSEDGRAGLDFWSRQNQSPFTRAVLPFERSGAVDRFSVESFPVPFDDRCSLAHSDLLLAGWILLIRRLSGCADLPVGLVCDGRDHVELSQAQGLLARCVPFGLPEICRVPLSRALGMIRRVRTEATRWQQCFSWEHLAAQDERPYLPYIYEEREQAFAAPADPGTPGFTVKRRSALTDRFHLCLQRESAVDGGTASILYDRDRFRASDIELLACQLAALLKSMRAAPDSLCSDLSLLGEDEEREIVVRFNDTRREFADELAVHEIFTRHAAMRPDSLAVICENNCVTYRELNARANRCAHRLRRMGIGAETKVALFVERSAELIAGLLSVLKAGGAYVPLDPVLPRERLANILADSSPAALLVDPKLLALLPDVLPPALFTDDVSLTAERTDNPGGITAPANLAYVIYTSGSTGRPKGVAIEHRQLRNYALGLLERAPLPAGAVWATASTIAADLGNTSIFGALCSGGCLQLITSEQASDPQAFSMIARQHPIDALKLVPSHLKALLGNTSTSDILPRRQLILGGESCSWDLVERVRQLAPDCRVLNHYGPTETTVGVLTSTVSASGAPDMLTSLPLNRPLANSRVYLLDESLRVAPRWALGEIFIGGEGLTRGYLNRPAETAERFVPDPIGREPGARLYRTGDLARHRSGEEGIEFLGRIDHQVKIRGFRVEPGEIAAVLREHPALNDALVVTTAEGSSGKRLVAYVVPHPGTAPEVETLRRYLADRLPDYMLPAAFVSLKALPLTANGKIDRDALPSPESEHRKSLPPRTAVEEVVAGFFADVLRIPEIGAHESFFDRGGHSLLVAQTVSRIRECFGVEISLQEFFKEPTATSLATRIQTERDRASGRPVPPIERVERGHDLPLSFGQQRLWFHDQLQPGSSFYNIFQPVELTGALEPETLRRVLREILRRHDVLRTTFSTVDGSPVQIVGELQQAPLPVVDLSQLAETEREREAALLVALESRRPFDLRSGPLVRVSLLRFEPDRHVMLVNMHHIVSDAWSMSLLVREAGEIYEAFAAGRAHTLPELPVQYADFAAWQRRWLSGDTLAAEIGWWRERLAGMPPVLEVPIDRPRPSVQSLRGGIATLLLPAELTASLRTLSRRQGATLFMTFLAAFKVQLLCLSGRTDVVVGTNVANRDRLETERLIGFFVNQLVLRTDLGGDPTFSSLLARVRGVVLDAIDHQHVPFEKLVEELRPPRSRSHSLLYQFKLEFRDGERESLRLGSLAVELHPFADLVARYDLHLSLIADGPGIRAQLLYDAALFEAATIEGWLEDFRFLLECVADDHELQVSQLRELLVKIGLERRARHESEYSDALLRRFLTAIEVVTR